MKAQILREPDVLEFAEIPVPLMKENEVLIKIKSACLCNGSDPSILKGAHWDEFPVIFGHEAFGEIIDCGKAVSGFELGDMVTWWFSMGAFAEYICINPDKVAMLKVPSGTCGEEGAVLELAIAAARVFSNLNVKKGSKVLIVGLGPSGLIMTQLAKSMGAVVIGWDLYEMRRNKAMELGAYKAFDNSKDDAVALTIKEGFCADIVIDAFGDDILEGSPTLNNALKVIKPYGQLISYGHPVNGRVIDVFELQRKCVSMRGPENDLNEIRKISAQILDLLIQGRLNLKALVSEKIPLDDINRGIKLVCEQPDKYIKILVETEC